MKNKRVFLKFGGLILTALGFLVDLGSEKIKDEELREDMKEEIARQIINLENDINDDEKEDEEEES